MNDFSGLPPFRLLLNEWQLVLQILVVECYVSSSSHQYHIQLKGYRKAYLEYLREPQDPFFHKEARTHMMTRKICAKIDPVCIGSLCP
jgi:hypothetical protein